MPMKLIKHLPNVHEIVLKGNVSRLAILSDIHWDNPKSDWVLLKKHLDYCVKESIPIMINGDLFCLMQGKGDRRANKSDIRPEHNNAKYLDSVVDTAIDWWEPYAHLITVLGYGNHCTSIIKWQETDILKRFAQGLNIRCGTNIQVGGYGGWIILRQEMSKTKSVSFKIKYFHGSGGGGIVTKGAINLTRALESYEGFDVFAIGHIHENASRNDYRDALDVSGGVIRLTQKQIHHVITGTYKEEYGDGSKGWHVERGAPIKMLGGRIVEFQSKETKRIIKNIRSFEFPI